MLKRAKNNLKKLISWTIGVPSAIVMFSEVEDVRYWFLPFVAAGMIIGILCWNHIFATGGSHER